MEEITLAVLPRETENVSEGSSVATDLPVQGENYALRCIQSEEQSTNPGGEYAIDPSLHNQINNGSTYGMEATFEGHDLRTRPPLEQDHSFEVRGSQILKDINYDAGQDDTGGDRKKKKGSASSIDNDLDLRRLFRENEQRPLEEVAAEVLSNEQGPKAEKIKQIFAMLW